MVLRNACLHTLLDDRDHRDQYPRTMSDHYALPTLLLFPRRLRQESILAAYYNVPLFRPSELGPFVSRLLPTALFPVAGREQRTVASSLFLAVALRNGVATDTITYVVYSVSRICS